MLLLHGHPRTGTAASPWQDTIAARTSRFEPRWIIPNASAGHVDGVSIGSGHDMAEEAPERLATVLASFFTAYDRW